MKDKKGKKKEKDEDSAEPSQKPEAGVASIIILWKERWCVGCAIFGRTGFVYTSPIPSCRNWRQSIWKSLRLWRHIYIYIYLLQPLGSDMGCFGGVFPVLVWVFRHQD